LAYYDDRTGSALTQAATELRSPQLQVIAQRVQQWRARIQVQGVDLPIHFQSDRAHVAVKVGWKIPRVKSDRQPWGKMSKIDICGTCG
jgi:hypothetical protein